MKEIIFNNFVLNMSDLDIARYFIAMLYLAMKGKIVISYEDSKEIDNNKHNESVTNDDEDKIKVTKHDNKNLESIKISVANNKI
jgi:hypothetical protein